MNRRAFLANSAVAIAGLSVAAQPAVADTRKLKAQLDAIAAPFKGTLGYSVHHIKNRESIDLRGDERFPTASTIKLAIMCTAFEKQQKGEIGYFDTRSITDADKRTGAGFIQHYRPDTKIELKELLHLMITISDNMATAMLIRWLTAMEINHWLERQGFKVTRLLSQLPENETGLIALYKEWGLGVTTPNEMRDLMERIATGKAGTPAATDEMQRLLSHQYFTMGIGSQVPPFVGIGSKSGAVDASRSDVAIVHAPTGDYSLSIYTKEAKDQSWEWGNEGENAIRAISRAVFTHYNPKVDWAPKPGYDKF
ncbi:MAG: serine hydrolase [Chthonomonadales bacterium]